MQQIKITFVTAIFDICKEEQFDLRKTKQKRIQYFEEVASTGIFICIFCCPKYKILLNDILIKYTNIKLVEVLTLNKTNIYKICNDYEISNNKFLELPLNRHMEKDIKEYMILMNSKIEFLKKSIDINYFNSKFFCWFDFSILYIFKNKTDSLNKFKELSYTNFSKNFICIPGCWNRNNYDYLNNIVWRFCGGIMLGDKQSLIDFYNNCMQYFPIFLQQTNKLVWEINFWYWLETIEIFNPIWVNADHNDSIINNLYEKILYI